MARERPVKSDDVYPESAVGFLQWALPKLGYRWSGYRKPRRQVLRRIRNRMADTGCTSYADYARYLERNSDEWEFLDASCDITISRFFRDRKLWDNLRDHVFPELISLRWQEPVRIWSAGCCNGEEAYSAAIMLMESAEGTASRTVPDVPGRVLATDRNPEVLHRAESALYDTGSLKEATCEEKQKWFEIETGGIESRVDEPGHPDSVSIKHRVRPEVRRLVTFRQHDISRTMPDDRFDIIFCRNLVFTYFTTERQITFLESLYRHMETHGYLIIGAHEQLPDCRTKTRFQKKMAYSYKMRDPQE